MKQSISKNNTISNLNLSKTTLPTASSFRMMNTSAIMQLQQTIGNQAVMSMLQPKKPAKRRRELRPIGNVSR